MFNVGKPRRLVCAGTAADGSPCRVRVTRLGDRCEACLTAVAESGDAAARLSLAGDPVATPALLSTLAVDDDAVVRLAVAGRPDTPLIELQRLEEDSDRRVRAVAGETLSAALTPRAFDDSDPGSLFTPAELDALGPPGARLRPIAGWADRAARRPLPSGGSGVGFEDLEDVITRLESLGERLTALEAALSSTGARLGAVTQALGELAGDPPPDDGAAIAAPQPMRWLRPPVTRPQRDAGSR